MPLSTNLLFSISASLSHAFDFTFYGHSGEIANRVREEMGEQMPSVLRELKIDSDGDVTVKTSHNTFYVTPTGISTSGWFVFLKELQAAQFDEYSRIIDLLGHASTSLAVESYSVRLLFRFAPTKGSLSLLKPNILDSVFRAIFPDKTPPNVDSFKTSAKFAQGPFRDTLELEASSEDVQLRYSRLAAENLQSYASFLKSADLNGIVADLAPFLESLATL